MVSWLSKPWDLSGWNWPLGAAQKPADEPELVLAPDVAPDVIARGEAARRLLNDPTLLAALTEIEQTAVEMWKACKLSEIDRREELFRTIKSIELLRSKLRAFRDAGAVKRAEQEAA